MKHEWEPIEYGELRCTKCSVILPVNRREDGDCYPTTSYSYYTCFPSPAERAEWEALIAKVQNKLAQQYLRFLSQPSPEAENERRLVDFEFAPTNLPWAFMWDLTPKGHEFWRKINNALRKVQ